MKKLACLFLIIAASGCPDIKVDENETGAGTIVEFDPANKIIPFPNNLLLDPTTGKIKLPAQCGELPVATVLREGVLNKLDGFGVFEPALTVTFSADIDVASLTDHIVIYKRASGATQVDPATAVSLPFVIPQPLSMTAHFDANCANPVMVPQLVIVPRVPLDQKSSYVVALTEGIKSTKGEAFGASGTWRLIRGAKDPVVIENGHIVSDDTPLDPSIKEDRDTLFGIDLLWKAHAAALKFLAEDLPTDKRVAREKILLAWEFNTQTSTDPLDPAVAGSPASEVDRATGLLGNLSVTTIPQIYNRTLPPFLSCNVGDSDVQCFLKISLGQGSYAVGNAACAQLGCAAINDVVASNLSSKQYQVDTLNPYTGTGAKKIPGPWGDPNDPAEVKTEAIGVLTTIPTMAAPATGYPVVIFQHAIGQTKGTALAIAGQLAARGFVTVAIDAVGHDSRAVRNSNDAAKGCGDVTAPFPRPDLGPSPLTAPQCYAPFLSSDLAATRDSIRQTVIDQLRLVAALKVCGTTNCGPIKVDPAHILYIGQSLGGIFGNISVAMTADIKAAVLNAPAVGWGDIVEKTQTPQLKCPLVDALIAAGVVQGTPSSPPPPAIPTSGTCLTDGWQDQPGYRQFSVIARWILDPADPANFTRKLATRRFLIQEVVGDSVFPNFSTTNEGMLVGLMPGVADRVNPPPPLPTPSGPIVTNPMTSKWVRYPTLPADAAMGFPGNTFGHGSLLQPVGSAGAAGQLGTLRLQTDAIGFILFNQ